MIKADNLGIGVLGFWHLVGAVIKVDNLGIGVLGFWHLVGAVCGEEVSRGLLVDLPSRLDSKNCKTKPNPEDQHVRKRRIVCTAPTQKTNMSEKDE